MLGNEEDARFIRDWHFARQAAGDDYDYDSGDWRTPKGWQRLGSGVFRVAYLSPDGVVYKVQQFYPAPGTPDRRSQSNRSEADNLRKFWLTKLPMGCRLPRWHFFELDGRGVMAMECFQKTLYHYSRYSNNGKKYWARLERLERMLNLMDLHGGNLAVDEESEKLVPIDLGA